MTPGSYCKDRAVFIVVGAACALGVAGMFAVLGQGVDAAVLSATFVGACWAIALALDYARRRRFCRELETLSEELDQAYYASALMEEPSFLEGRLAYRALERVGKAAADDVTSHKQEAEAYREYVELWIHEVKTPIAAAALMASGLHGSEGSRIKGEIDRIESYVEQALYYARSTSVERDYAIRETALAQVVREACKKNARYLIERGTLPIIELDDDVRVFADGKWLGFIIGQVLSNAAKYGATSVRFSLREVDAGTKDACSMLEIADDGRGIPAADVPRVFERGFTGSNGRERGSSAGMGLYLVSQMCRKMGLGVAIASEEGVGTRVLMRFPHDRRRLDASR